MIAALSLRTLDHAFRAAWAADTCSPDDAAREPWHPGNPAWGHCDITALAVHDLFGGDLVLARVELEGGADAGYHWWNRLPSGLELDLTYEQFRRGQRLVGAETVVRPTGPLKRRMTEYHLLRERLAAALGRELPPAGN
ncbi:YunG family protein [Yinghuangia sp. YIM S09857]|uniref:YunG family protein n=1 Tax=Yinghuangia sp. YIM S09857 TaxID=3436929 RepID=UPI003F53AF65